MRRQACEERSLGVSQAGQHLFAIEMNAHSRFGQTHDLAAESAQPAAKGPQLPALLEGRESLLRKRLACVVHQGSFVGRRGMLDLGECVLSDGREVALHFRKVTVQKPIPIVPASPQIQSEGSEVLIKRIILKPLD